LAAASTSGRQSKRIQGQGGAKIEKIVEKSANRLLPDSPKLGIAHPLMEDFELYILHINRFPN